MIIQHQPTIFEGMPLKVACSSLEDGTMQLGQDVDNTEVLQNRQRFLESAGTSTGFTTLLRTVYEDGVVYDRILDIDKRDVGKGMLANADIAASDALFTVSPGQALFLPIADCGGVVLFDAKRKALGLVHLGRHATTDGLAEKAVEHMQEHYGTNPGDIHVWISPAITGESYWLHTFDVAHKADWRPHLRTHDGGWFVDLQGYNVDRFIEAGIPKSQIERSPVNVATDPGYPSHYEHNTNGKPEKAGRFAIVAYITA